jgi:hypothetical protein
MTEILRSENPNIVWSNNRMKGFEAYPEYTFAWRAAFDDPNSEYMCYDGYTPQGTNNFTIGFDELEVSIIYTPIE